jgi:hypothetical protein
MRRAILILALCAVAFGLGIGFVHLRSDVREKRPDPPSVVTRLREVARLETLEVNVYNKISFAPDPKPGDTLWGEVKSWAKSNLAPSRGKAIVFATVHVGLDLDKLDARHLRITGQTVQLVLPPLQSQVELRPGETEVIDSNLSSAETAQLLQLAKEAFEHEVASDPKLKARAGASAQRAITGVLFNPGFRKVEFVDRLPGLDSN